MKKKIYLGIEKEAGKTLLKIQLPKEIEDFFNQLSEGKSQPSSTWGMKKDGEKTGASFYKLTEDYNKLDESFDRYKVYNDFGDGLLRQGRVNIALLRVVGAGAKKGVKIFSDKFEGISNLELRSAVETIGEYTKMLWEQFISKKKLKAVITLEI